MRHSGPESLDEFRRSISERRILDTLSEYDGRVRIDLPVGVGKSYLLDNLVEFAVSEGLYDLVVVFMPTRQLIQERRWIQQPPTGVRIVNLRPRPRDMCGDENNRQWCQFEERGMGALGRVTLCRNCIRVKSCFWPGQYSEQLEGAHVIYAAQAHLQRSPDFVDSLQSWTKAERILVLVDEGNFITSPFRQVIDRDALKNLVDVLREVERREPVRILSKWLEYCELLLTASTDDLRTPDWILMPLNQKATITVQQMGWDMLGADFRYLGAEITQFSRSMADTRAKRSDGAIRFAAPPKIGQDFIFFSGTTSPEMATYRLGLDFHSPFEGEVFNHPDTRWYNIANKIGMASYFAGNSPQIFDFYADVIVKKIREGKRPLLLSRLKFQRLCIEEMQKRIATAGLKGYSIIKGDSDSFNPDDKKQIPIIHYGMIGTNAFEHYDGVYCLNGYYVSEAVVNNVLQDVLAEDFHLDITITAKGSPPRRRAGVTDPENRIYNVHPLSQNALDDQEMGVVIQAVGRVRPFTKSREVLMFQCGEVPRVAYDAEFLNLAEARSFFGFNSAREKKKKTIQEQVKKYREKGLTQKQTAKKVERSVRTVKRYWQGDTGPL